MRNSISKSSSLLMRIAASLMISQQLSRKKMKKLCRCAMTIALRRIPSSNEVVVISRNATIKFERCRS